MPQYNLIKTAFNSVWNGPTFGPKPKGRWLTDELLCSLVNKKLIHLTLEGLTRKQFNRGLSAHPEFKDQIDRQQKNSTGLYRIEFSNMFFFWIGDKPKFPQTTDDGMESSHSGSGISCLRGELIGVRDDQAEIENARGEDETPAKRPPRHEVSVPTARPAQIQQASVPTMTPAQIQQAPDLKVTPEQIQRQTYFDSPEAVRVFFPTKDDESVLACIERRIKLFVAVGDTAEGWRLVIDGSDPDDLC
jgi:hypothetical protein